MEPPETVDYGEIGKSRLRGLSNGSVGFSGSGLNITTRVLKLL